MKNMIGGLIICAVILSIIGKITESKNFARILKASGAGDTAQKFVKACTTKMNASFASFHYGTPSVNDGCICIGVKLQEAGTFDRANIKDVNQMYDAFIVQNISEMIPALRAFKLSTPDKQVLGTDIRYSNKPTILPPKHDTPETQYISRIIMKSYAYCDERKLDGVRRVIPSKLPKHLQ